MDNTNFDPTNIREDTPKKSRVSFFGLIVFFAIGIFLLSNIAPPKNFKEDTFIKVDSGTSLIALGSKLKTENIIKSELLFQAVVILFGNEKRVIAGEYYFEKPVSLFEVARMVSIGDFNYKQIKVTIPEGYRRDEMAKLLEKSLPLFDASLFMTETKDLEGYLFPDTYFFSPNSSNKDIVDRLKGEFDSVIGEYEDAILKSGKTKHEIITLASIVEKEGNGEEDRPIISGILLKRLSIGMALQVDATFLYINGKGSSELTKADLKLDNLYNTYVYKGIPPGPIGSPGEDSIRAVLNPVTTDYLYYLHDKKGVAHFAKTYEEHLKNKRAYLD